MVGRNLTDTVGYGLGGHVPALEGLPRHNCDGIGGMHVYVPWWLLDKKNKDFPRGYHIEIGGGFGMPQLGSFHGACRAHEGYGKALKEQDPRGVRHQRRLRRPRRNDSQRAHLLRDRSAGGRSVGHPGAALPLRAGASTRSSRSSTCTIPSPTIIETMGGKVTGPKQPERETRRHLDAAAPSFTKPARCAWATIRRQSVLNKYCQAHEVKNLFVCDAAPFVSNPDKNVTLTIVAFAWRASEYLAEEMRKGNV